jgi:hypothetical protein
MFGLPLSTTLLVFGFPAFWIAYTIGFMIVSRSWVKDSNAEETDA